MGCRVFRVGVFFDGTGNNKFIDAQEVDGSESNIAKLYELYNEHNGEVDTKDSKPLYTAKIYKEGIGTKTKKVPIYYDKHGIPSKEKHKVKGRRFITDKTEKGAGGDGAKRIEEAIDSVLELLANHDIGSGSSDYCERIIDVFGFSRGAAQARDFINTFHNRNNKTWKLESLKLGFVGIYDTVGAFGSAGDNNNFKPINPDKFNESDGFGFDNHENTVDKSTRKGLGHFNDGAEATKFAKLKQAELGDAFVVKTIIVGSYRGHTAYTVNSYRKAFQSYNFHLASASAKKILHLVSNDEVRRNFPLQSLLKNQIHEELAFPGVHSDIGGGYADEEIEPHSFFVKTITGSKGFWNFLFDAKQYAKEYGSKELAKRQQSGELSENWKVKVKKETFLGRKLDEYKVFFENNRKVNNDLSKVTLHIMHEVALSSDVPFKVLPQNKAHAISSEMQSYYTLYKQNRMIFVKGKESEIKNFKELSQSVDFDALDKEYRHHSAVDPAEVHSNYDGHTSWADMLFKDSPDNKMFAGNDARYEGDTKGRNSKEVFPRKQKGLSNIRAKREIYANVPKKAIVPKGA